MNIQQKNNNLKSWHFFWLEQAKLFPEVLQNPKLENTFNEFGEKIYNEGYQDGFSDGEKEGQDLADELSYQHGYEDGRTRGNEYEKNKD